MSGDKISQQIILQFEITRKVVEKEIESELIKLGLKKRKLTDERYVRFWLDKHKILLLTDEDDGYIVYTLIKGKRIIKRWKLETIDKAVRRTGDDLVERHN